MFQNIWRFFGIFGKAGRGGARPFPGGGQLPPLATPLWTCLICHELIMQSNHKVLLISDDLIVECHNRGFKNKETLKYLDAAGLSIRWVELAWLMACSSVAMRRIHLALVRNTVEFHWAYSRIDNNVVGQVAIAWQLSYGFWMIAKNWET